MTTGSKRIKLSELFLESIDRNTQCKGTPRLNDVGHLIS